ncbi:MAG: PepSY-like domain-containing protein [Bacteroidales bacterium]|nr:PepSY-like domain-containing protein [Bacteroidales bacterium]
MKKLFVLLLGLMTLNVFAANDRPVTFKQLPQKAQQFINTHFSGIEMLSATVDDDYEVYLANGAKVEFTLQGDWKEVRCSGSAVPAAIIPAAISKYVKTNFPNNTITKIDKNYSGYDIELSTDVELKFDKNGKFLAFDD